MLYALCTMLSIACKQCEPASLLPSAQSVMGQEHPALLSPQALLQQMLPCVISENLLRQYNSVLQTLLVLPVMTSFVPNSV